MKEKVKGYREFLGILSMAGIGGGITFLIVGGYCQKDSFLERLFYALSILLFIVGLILGFICLLYEFLYNNKVQEKEITKGILISKDKVLTNSNQSDFELVHYNYYSGDLGYVPCYVYILNGEFIIHPTGKGFVFKKDATEIKIPLNEILSISSSSNKSNTVVITQRSNYLFKYRDYTIIKKLLYNVEDSFQK